MYEGGCFCGAVRYRAEGPPSDETHCHCSICRRLSAAAFVTWATFPRDGFAWSGTDPRTFRSSERATRTFCPSCGTPLTFQLDSAPEQIDVTVASLDRPERIAPRDHTHTASRLPWVVLADGLPAFSGARASSDGVPTAREHPNALRVRELFRAFATADVAAIQAAIADDAVWHFPGRRGRIAGAHRGHTAIFEFLGQVVALTEGSFGLELADVVANDERAVALFRGHGRRGDRALDNPTCLVIRLREGRAVEIFEYVWDLYAVDDFWA